jgi:hypothetical protein
VLAEAAGTRSSRTVLMVHNSLERAIRHAEANDYVLRNVAALVDSPTGQTGRPSRSLTIEQGASLLAPAEASPLGAYVVLCLLTGVRTEEARALTWDHVDLDGSAARGRQALAMAFKLIEAAQDRWRAVNAPHLVALVSAPERPSSTANSSNDPAGTPGRKPPEDRIPQAVTIAPLILSMRTSGRGSVEVIDAGRAVGAGQPGTSEGDAGHLSYSLAVTSGCLLPRCLLDSV